MARSFDIVVLADPRFPGGTSTALAEELHAGAAANWRTALLPLESAALRFPHPFHPAVRAALDAGAAELVEPGVAIEAGLVLAHHPELFRFQPTQSLRLRAEQRLLIVHHPPRDAEGQPFYDPAAIARNAEESLGGPVLWAPVGPAVRAQLDGALALLPEDWVNVIDAEPWRVHRDGFKGERCVLGRHSRPDPLKWPATRAQVLEAYPEDPRFAVHVLGGGPFLVELMGARLPPNWQVRPFLAGAAPAFLAGLDFFVYYHHPRWVEAFGRTVLEALAAGCVAILPPLMAPLFGEAAVYADRAQAPAAALELRAAWASFRSQSEIGAAIVRERFGPERHRQRLKDLLGRPGRRIAPARPRRVRRVLFLTTNGVGLGHLTRAMAIARRLPAALEPVIVTMSQALAIVRRQGFVAHYLPYHQYLGVEHPRWNHWLRQELRELFALYDPAVILFDGNVPHGGIVQALADRRSGWAVWVRRGMWRPGSGGDALTRESAFDCVLEPGEHAGAWDRGPTRDSTGRTRRVAPVRLLDDTELATRAAARAELELPEGTRAVLVSLGAGNNFDYRPVLERLGTWLATHPEIAAFAAVSPIAAVEVRLPPALRRLELYPSARLLAGFDAAVSAAGYNSFHELLAARLPTLFVPNEHPIMDDQLGRARWAERTGVGLLLRTVEPYHLPARLEALLDPMLAAELTGAMGRLDPTNGAIEAALVVDELARIVRTERG